jgi:hypothetical protein
VADKKKTPTQVADEIVNSVLGIFDRIERLLPSEDKALAKQFMDIYANAQLGVRKKDIYTLQQGDLALFFLQILPGMDCMTEKTIEELYLHPIGKGEQPKERANKLFHRYRQIPHAVSEAAHVCSALMKFYGENTVKGTWWHNVYKELIDYHSN